MSPRYYPQLIPWLKAHAKTLGLAAMLGLGFPACAGDDEAGEPVEAQDGVVEEGDGSGSSEEASAEGVAEEGQAAPVTETDLAGESEAGGADGGLEGEPSSASDTTAPPPDVMDASTETVDAEFGEAEGDTPPPIASDTTAAPEAAPEMETADASLASMAPAATDMSSAGTAAIAPGVVASPGAVMNLGNGPAQGYSAASTGSSSGSSENVYVVVPGDTIGRIAKKVYGNAGQWKSLAEQNGLKKPYWIFPGNTLRYSGNAVAQSTKMFTVRKGDTLSGIATKLYGSAFAWKALLTYNKDKITNPNVIPVGMKLAYVDSGNASAGAPSKKATKAKAKNKTAKASKKSKAAKVEAPAKAKKPAAVTAPDPEEAAADMAPAAEPAAVEETVKEETVPQAENDAFPEKAEPAAEPAPETEEELEE